MIDKLAGRWRNTANGWGFSTTLFFQSSFLRANFYGSAWEKGSCQTMLRKSFVKKHTVHIWYSAPLTQRSCNWFVDLAFSWIKWCIWRKYMTKSESLYNSWGTDFQAKPTHVQISHCPFWSGYIEFANILCYTASRFVFLYRL